MKDLSPRDYYSDACRLGSREYSSRVSNGQIGYLPSLEGILRDTDVVSRIELGAIELPLKKIRGTYTHLRSLSFAANFMPMRGNNTEFQGKWIALCEAHLNEGIRDPIKVYEYLNWYYVVEGNKRISVLKYFGAYSMTASVIRLVPKMDSSSHTIQLYYEFLKFNRTTKIISIWFTRRGSFAKLQKFLDDYNPKLMGGESKYRYFEIYIYNTFRRIYYELRGDRLPITTGDAFLEYAKIYGIPDRFNEDELRRTVKELIKELELLKRDDIVDIQTAPEENSQGGVLSTITTFIRPAKKLKVAFAYARTIETSGWTYTHELGRRYLEQVMGDQVETSYIENVPENDGSYSVIKSLADNGNDVIFTTSPVFRNASLRCALRYPDKKFFNCSEHRPYKHLSNYYGRTYEPRFLTGIIAGAMTRTNLLGYAATSPTPEVISCINAFALGARMVNPDATVKVTWTREWNSHERFTDADKKLVDAGADIISNRNLTIPREVTTQYGVYSMLCIFDPKTKMLQHHLAAPIWHWGTFYERILKNLISEENYIGFGDALGLGSKLVNFWWGMDSGVLDIYYVPKYVPPDTQKLVDLLKRIIIGNDFNPFTGPIADINGVERVPRDEAASQQQILKMNWFVDNVDAEKFPQ